MGFSNRLYEDYFKKSRLKNYEDLLRYLCESDYRMIGILDFYHLVSKNKLSGKFCINRHDIDTSPKVARELFEIEKRVYGKNGSSTYYFRDTTIDLKLIREIEDYGYEASYHYEELAAFEKKNKTKNPQKLIQHLQECRAQFVIDISQFRKKTGARSLSVASHGDFINSKYKIQNYELLKDDKTREKAGVEIEAYDIAIMQYVKKRYADQVLLSNFTSEVIAGIQQEIDVIMLLTHPRNWKVDVLSTTKENLTRLCQGIRYKI